MTEKLYGCYVWNVDYLIKNEVAEYKESFIVTTPKEDLSQVERAIVEVAKIDKRYAHCEFYKITKATKMFTSFLLLDLEGET